MDGTNMYEYPPPRHYQGHPIPNGYYGHPYNEGTSSYQQGLPTNFMTRKQWHQHVASGYRPDRKMLSCGPCNRTFFSQQRLDEHLKDHVECPFPECKLSAHIKVIDQHINNQHMLVNFAALQIDDETWIAERKKRFPTARRAELRRAQQMEKLKRGEKLGVSKKPFAKNNVDRGFKRGRRGEKIPHKKDKTEVSDVKDGGEATGNKEDTKQREIASSHVDKEKLVSEESTSGQSSWQKRTRFERPPRPTIEVDLYDSDKEPLGVPPFKGTKQFYESTGEMNYFSSTHLTKDSPMKDFAISDDEEWESEQKEEGDGKLVLGGALGSLMGTYSDSEDSEGDDAATTAKANVALSLPTEQKQNMPTEHKQDLSNMAKDEQKANGSSKSAEVPVNRSRKRHRNHRNHTKNKRPTKFPRRPRRRKNLLERLLQADIIHERNLILQCARFIVENNFFERENPKEVEEEQLESRKKEEDLKISFQKPQDKTVSDQITSCKAVSSCDEDVTDKKLDSKFDVIDTSKSNLESENLMVSGESEKSSSVDCNVTGNSVTERKRKNQSVDDCDAPSDSTLEGENKPSAVDDNMADDSNIKPGKSAIECSVTKDSIVESKGSAVEFAIPSESCRTDM